jgi:predicted house-cleaning noncanonical NTP pyrophosphatase (MazG superfamily)
MKKVFYNKLVRDGIKAKIERNGETCVVRELLDNEEFEQELLKKVREEAEGLAKAGSRAEFLEEYADLMAVLDALTQQLEISEAEIRVAITENVAKKGLYKERHFLHWSAAGEYKSNETPQGIT